MFEISVTTLAPPYVVIWFAHLSHLLSVPQPLHVASSLLLSCYQPHAQAPRMAILVVVREQ
jgi:hypothetical protein